MLLGTAAPGFPAGGGADTVVPATDPRNLYADWCRFDGVGVSFRQAPGLEHLTDRLVQSTLLGVDRLAGADRRLRRHGAPAAQPCRASRRPRRGAAGAVAGPGPAGPGCDRRERCGNRTGAADVALRVIVGGRAAGGGCSRRRELSAVGAVSTPARRSTARRSAAGAAGLSAREIADHPGHERVSMTRDGYLSRKATGANASAALDAFGPESVG